MAVIFQPELSLLEMTFYFIVIILAFYVEQ